MTSRIRLRVEYLVPTNNNTMLLLQA